MQRAAVSSLQKLLRWFASNIRFFVVAAPFLYSLYWVGFRLEPIEMVDAFPFLWNAPISAAYFTGRSLTTRVLFSLCRQDPRTIAVAHLACAALLGMGAYVLGSERASPRAKFLLGVAIALLATSFNSSFGTIALIPEPVFLYLAIAFPLVVIFARGRLRTPLILGVGALAIFSKNTAPGIVLSELGAYAAVRVRKVDFSSFSLRALVPYAAVAGLAILSMVVTRTWDTSVQINAANNIFRRVLLYPALVAHFQERHGMPRSRAVDALKGQYVMAQLDGRAIFRVNRDTRNYELVPGGDAFLQWVATKAFGEYVRHLIFHEPVTTWVELDRALTDLYAPSTVAVLSHYVVSHAVDKKAASENAKMLLGHDYDAQPFDDKYYLATNPDAAEAVQRRAIASARAHYELYGKLQGRRANAADPGLALPNGLLRFDPVGTLTRVFATVRLNRLWILCALILASGYAARRFPMRRGFAFSCVLLVGSLSGFFVGYFGDALELERHVWAHVITLTLAFSVLTVVSYVALAAANGSGETLQERA